MRASLPVLGEEGCEGVTQDLALVVDVLEDILGPLHQVADLVARRRAVHVPDQLLLHFLTQHILDTHTTHTHITYVGLEYTYDTTHHTYTHHSCHLCRLRVHIPHITHTHITRVGLQYTHHTYTHHSCRLRVLIPHTPLPCRHRAHTNVAL